MQPNSGGSDNSTTAGGLVITLQGRPGPGAPAPRLIQSTPAHLAIRPVHVAGGTGGHSGGQISSGAGGACYGRGGNGSHVNGQTNTRTYTWDTPGTSATGEPGLLIQTIADPTTLF